MQGLRCVKGCRAWPKSSLHSTGRRRRSRRTRQLAICNASSPTRPSNELSYGSTSFLLKIPLITQNHFNQLFK